MRAAAIAGPSRCHRREPKGWCKNEWDMIVELCMLEMDLGFFFAICSSRKMGHTQAGIGFMLAFPFLGSILGRAINHSINSS